MNSGFRFSHQISRVQSQYRTNERLFGVLFFVAGIVWDALTLRRIDNLVDNAILVGYLVLLTGIVVASILVRSDKDGRLARVEPWLAPVIQFLLGALLSAFVIFYAQSIAWVTHLGFWLILVLGMIANEFLHRRFSSLTSLLIFLMLSSTSMLAWLYPVLAGHMAPVLFRAAIASGLVLSLLLLVLGIRKKQFSWGRLGSPPLWYLLGCAILLDVGYRQNWIPPVPLSVEAGGVYQQVVRDGDAFELEYKTRHRGLLAPKYARQYYHTPGEPVYAFTSVFAPTDLKERIFHVWQRQDETSEKWVTTDRIGYDLTGGRDDGFRGMTFKQNISEGDWRIIVETSNGKTVSRIPFTVTFLNQNDVYWTRTLRK
ncbi:MAG: DUF2914 domain-containing protein [Rhodothermales bacterium]|nr:DUF2914 domain-containing protein [Rhodothermales bacterium]MDG2016466.1 DUF2914 domain-containing protein [Rhodothermales bacterium]HAY36272.1 DUF2914 domain-containing protein [Bacteroidota bacterium]